MKYASLAQQVEHLAVNQGVGGSIPSGRAKHNCATKKLNKKECYMSLIQNLQHDDSDNAYYGNVHLNLFNQDCQILIEDGASVEYAERCVDHFNHIDQSTIDKLLERLYKYYQFMLKECGQECIEDSLKEFAHCKTVPNVTQHNILQYVKMKMMVIEKPKQDIAAYSISGDCAWEPEHGVEIIINGDNVLYVGEFSGNGPWRSSKSYICVF